MTVAEARKLLASTRLKFGDEDQIKAVDLLSMAEHAKELEYHPPVCSACKGTGVMKCRECEQETDCDECDGAENSFDIECADAKGLRCWIGEANEAIAAQT